MGKLHIKYFSFVALAIISMPGQSQQSTKLFQSELIYGRKDGMALSLFLQTPGKPNGKAMILVQSGNWRSGYDRALRFLAETKYYTDNGYTVFTVMPSSQPRYAIPDEIADLKRAVRFIRYNAKEYGIDANHMGITGFSSGGHLSLAVATADEKIDSAATDPIDRVSSRVQAVAVFYPPTDFLNYGRQNASPASIRTALILSGVYAAFDFKAFNDTLRSYVSITDEAKKMDIARQISPIYAVSPDDPPVLIFHGDADVVVPLQQSESIIQKLQAEKVPNKLIIKKGAGHGWKSSETEEKEVVAWFDQYLK